MRIEDRFTVGLPVDEAWTMLLDVERIAACIPGARLHETAEDEYRGLVQVQLGAIAAQFQGTVRFTEVDESAHRAVLSAKGREVRGQGTASATVTVTAHHADGDATVVAIATDLALTGRVAQVHQRVMADASAALVEEFSRCVEDRLAETTRGHVGDAADTTVTTASEPQPSMLPDTRAPLPERRPVVQWAATLPVERSTAARRDVAQRAIVGGVGAVLVLLAITEGAAKRWALSIAGGGLLALLLGRTHRSTSRQVTPSRPRR